jgi:hypothetical protein
MEIIILTDEIRKVDHETVTKDVQTNFYKQTPYHNGHNFCSFLNYVKVSCFFHLKETKDNLTELCKFFTLPFSIFFFQLSDDFHSEFERRQLTN